MFENSPLFTPFPGVWLTDERTLVTADPQTGLFEAELTAGVAQTPFRQRSPESANAPYRQYEVVGDLEVRGDIAAPWFGQPGGGVQYELPSSVGDLISRGILKPVG